jgi:hypothetical protein
MAVYKLSTKWKKSIEERTYWYKDGRLVTQIDGWRWGNWSGDFDALPDIDLQNEYGLDIAAEEGWDMNDLDDGCWSDWEFPDDMSEEEQEEFREAYDENYQSGLEELGWSNDDYECWLSGPLVLTDEDGNEVVGEEAPIQESKSDEVKFTPNAAWPFPTSDK